MANSYKKTMNLPSTEFPMRASLSQREPAWVERWEADKIHARAIERRKDAEPFILHDGPPYANGHIHMGTAYNKILKDLIVKYKTLRGYYSPYVPGWDCHGQPIEHMVEKNLGPEKMATISKADLRARCRDWALGFIDIQRDEFKRLGVLGDWNNPYLTLSHEYEAGNVEVFKKMYLDGAIYRGRKAIHWCMRCETALAEAEIEYGDESSTAVYVAYDFNVATPWDEAADGKPVSVLIWTTTPWTLPANGFVTLNADADYIGVRAMGRVLVFAEALLETIVADLGWEEGDYEVVAPKHKGSDLTNLTYQHPVFPERTCRIITDPYVELTTGTGAVHGAGGHGAEDNLLAVKHDLPIYMPVTDQGFFDAGGGPFEGLKVRKDDGKIVEWLQGRGALIGQNRISHSYPHCWRCKQPVIFRATEQWFVSMDRTALRATAQSHYDSFRWIPEWSRNRMGSMIADRPDWCISRQRSWGVPIPVHRCEKCSGVVATPETFDATIKLFKTEGADAWFIKSPAEYLPEGTACPDCGSSEIVAESDIVDVWWESGVSHTSVLEARPELHRPAQMYLEGSDQHRGWFQSSYLTSIGAYGTPPWENLLTHGFVVDGDGRKMSKSLGNTVSPIDVCNKLGAEIVRLWMSSADYSQDVSISDEILARTSESYRRIRNTFRFLLSNLYDYTPADAIAFEELPEVDQAELVLLADTLASITALNDDFRFHVMQREVSDYFGDLSSTYLDALKDRLYSEAPESHARRSAQTVLAVILGTFVRALSPVLSFTCEEAWGLMPEGMADAESVFLSDWPTVDVPADRAAELRERYGVVRTVRESVTKALETARDTGTAAKSQGAAVELRVPADIAAALSAVPAGVLEEYYIVAKVTVIADPQAEGVSVAVSEATGDKCPRCWNHRELGRDERYPDVCGRCAEALAAVGFDPSAE